MGENVDVSFALQRCDHSWKYGNMVDFSMCFAFENAVKHGMRFAKQPPEKLKRKLVKTLIWTGSNWFEWSAKRMNVNREWAHNKWMNKIAITMETLHIAIHHSNIWCMFYDSGPQYTHTFILEHTHARSTHSEKIIALKHSNPKTLSKNIWAHIIDPKQTIRIVNLGHLHEWVRLLSRIC